MQIDVGFDDVVTPEAQLQEYPATLNHPPAILRMYPAQTTIAEKVQAMIYLGELNSRMKDFFDILALSETFEFDGTILLAAVRATFEKRNTLVISEPVALTEAFMKGDAQQRWAAFVRRSRLECTSTFLDLHEPLRAFLIPLLKAAQTGETFDKLWSGGRWS